MSVTLYQIMTVSATVGYTVEATAITNMQASHQQELPTPPNTQATSKFGSVLRSAGEIRSGPSTSYEDIGRLKGGTPVTIYEQQQEASGRWWGRMDDGWVCMDYIVFGEDNSVAPDYNSPFPQPAEVMSHYCGDWWDINSRRCWMKINESNGFLDITIGWSSSAFESTTWNFVGEYDRPGDVVYYSNGICTEYKTGEDGIGRETVRYSNGSGIFVLRDGSMTWKDDIEGAGDTCIFQK